MPKPQTFLRRKYIRENNEPKRICQIYMVQCLQGQSWQPSQIQKIQTPNQSVRINKKITEVPSWAVVNQRQNFGYETQPESPISCFNDQESAEVDYFDNKNKLSFYSWDNADASENWYN